MVSCAQGWQPLCDFLGVAEPDEPFPRTNDTESFLKVMEGVFAQSAAQADLDAAAAPAEGAE